MRRREFIGVLGGAAAWPVMARAQQGDRMRRIGVLMPYAENDPETSPRVTALRQRLLPLGWTEGRNVRVMLLFNPPTAPYAQRMFEPFKAAASAIGVEAVASPVHDPAEIETVIAAFAREADSGLVVLSSAFMLAHRDLVIALAARHRLPAVYAFRYWAQSGGLISYGNVAADAYRQAATYIDRILRGATPADLPVQSSVKFELVINLKTAKALGLDVPSTLLARADEVIE